MGKGMDRRTFLKYSLATSAIIWAGNEIPGRLGIEQADVKELFSVDAANAQTTSSIFPQSVASGDPQPNGIVLWTRIAPQTNVTTARVAFEISTTNSFTSPILSGVVDTSSARDWTVKTQINNAAILADKHHYYRFIYNGVASRTGRFRALPSPTKNLKTVRFAYISCQDYTNGYYTALPYLANENVDFIVHLGDYIYETVRESSFQGGQVRPINLPSGRDRAEDLRDYRFLYKKYKGDPNLQQVHEQFAFINIWDDHEFANDCYKTFDTDTADPQLNNDPQRREDANRAWAEYTPTGIPYNATAGPLNELKIYRSFQFGNLLELVMTDERLYRDAHPCGESTTNKYATPGCANRTNPNRSMLGTTQRNWFLNKIKTSTRTWKIWGNQVMVMQNKILNTYVGSLFPELPVTGDVFLNLDQWDGWPAERELILRTVRDNGVKNFVTITGDIHTYFAGYEKVNFDNLLEPAVSTCFVCGSVTSANLEELATLGVGGPQLPPNRGDILSAAIMGSNPHIRYMNSSGHGYNIMEVTPTTLTCTMKSVDTIKKPQANLSTLRTFRVNTGEVVIRDATTGLPV